MMPRAPRSNSNTSRRRGLRSVIVATIGLGAVIDGALDLIAANILNLPRNGLRFEFDDSQSASASSADGVSLSDDENRVCRNPQSIARPWTYDRLVT